MSNAKFSLYKKLKSGRFGGSVVKLVSGNTIASAIPFIVSPLLTRLYSPSDFGLLGLYLAVFSFIDIFSTGRYDLAMLITKDESDAIELGKLSLLVTIIVSGICIVSVSIGGKEISELLGAEELGAWLWVIPFAIIPSCLNKIFNSLAIKKGEFGLLASVPVVGTIANSTTNIFLGLMNYGGGGLVIGSICATIVVFVSYSRKLKFQIVNIFRKYDRNLITRVGIKYSDFPKIELFSALVNNISLQAPIFLIGFFGDPILVGYYSLAMKMINKPATILAKSVSTVFKQKAIEEFNNLGHCRSVYIKVFGLLIFVSLLPFIAIIAFAPYLFEVVFGKDWRMAGELAQVLCPLLWIKFVGKPLCFTFYIRMKFKADFIYQICLSSITVLSIWFGFYYFNDVKKTLVLYAMSFSFLYVLRIVHSYRLSLKVQG